jgi:hypothetical protein
MATKTSTRKKKDINSYMKGIFGSSYKKQLALKKADKDAAKIKSKDGLMKYISNVKKNDLLKNTTKLPILIYTIIKLFNDLGRNKTFKVFIPSKNKLIATIISDKSNLVVKLQNLFNLFKYEAYSIIYDTTTRDPDNIFELYRTFNSIGSILKKTTYLNYKDPEVALNIIVFALNINKMNKLLDSKEDIYKEYFNTRKNSTSDDVKLSKIEYSYLLLLQDVLTCDNDASKCDIKSSEIYNKDYQYNNSISFKDNFKKLLGL